METKPEEFKAVFKQYTDMEITDEEVLLLHSSKNYKESDYTQVGTSNNLAHNIVMIMNSRSCFGFTTGSHTGEEVLMAAYHPLGDVPRGNMRNTEINRYLQQVSGLESSLEELSDRIFVKHTDVFNGMRYSINRDNPDIPVLMVTKGRSLLEIPAFSSVAKKNSKPFDIGSVVVYIDKNDTFYLPASLAGAL
jgi:alkaline phosphatase